MRNAKMTIWVVLMLFSIFSEVANAKLEGYVAEGKTVYFTDFETGQQTQIELVGLSEQVDYFESFAFSPIDDCLYAVGHWDNYLTVGGRQIERSLYKINPKTGNVTNNIAFLSSSHGLSNLPALAISSNGTPYAIELTSGGDLYALVDSTGPEDWIGVTHIGQTPPAIALAINSSDKGILWCADQHFRLLNLSDSTTTEIGEVTGPFLSLDYSSYGNLYAWGNKTLYQIDVDNLTSVSISSFTYGNAPFALVPEPSTLLLLGLGGLMLRKRC